MRILIIGSGGREHALAWTLKNAEALYIAPGNPGTQGLGHNLPLDPSDHHGIVSFARDEKIDLVVVGPEQPLANGLADALDQGGIACFGPTAAAAEIESSKSFAKALMQRNHIPTAEWRSFEYDQYEEAKTYAQQLGPCVVKASGLAAGKGAIMCEHSSEAEKALRELLIDGNLGDAGKEVVIEEWMTGEEASLFILTDGDDYLLLDSAQDHKRVFDSDQGPNTGGMGAYAPAPVMTQQLIETTCSTVIEPVLQSMASEGRRYKGCLYAGLMITDEGPKVVEFNCRFGDPEAQVVLPLMDGDPMEMLLCAATGGIGNLRYSAQSKSAACVVLASGGYPGSYPKGKVITGLKEASEVSESLIFHAGTSTDGNSVFTNGGRVLGVTAIGSTLQDALLRAYQAADIIKFEGKHYRRDIGHRALHRE